MLQIYDSLTKEKQAFNPITPGKVKIYVCGITVYDYCHIGHGRVFVVFDVVTRYLRFRGLNVDYIRNITDIDDKIIKRAQENGENIEALTDRYIEAMLADEAALNIIPPTAAPRATHHIDDIIRMIETLIEKGFAYAAENGDVYYSVKKFSTYGQLAHQDIASLSAGHRVDILDVKQDPLDFALWKVAKPEEPSWPSPWGAGRPGWHIECSAMSCATLGEQFDIHGGGMDLMFPHHQNEIAQSEGATGKKSVNLWMHNGFVQVDEEKMSKSLGNFFTVRDVLKVYDAEIIRFFMLASHYRSPINYSLENLESARQGLSRLYMSLRDLPDDQPEMDSKNYEQRFVQAMDDDFNTPEALSVLFDMARKINTLKSESKLDSAAGHAVLLKRLANEVFGILHYLPVDFLQGDAGSNDVLQIETLIKAREDAREEKNWARADEIRHELRQLGIEIEDRAGGTQWRRKRSLSE